ncbi:leucine-rich repeat-containing protein 47-like isoform X1 [Nylanderia fulva]|uniref:leucine-rich repeat-containing protein 47-like isoform X1 n=1 Tax=Nylanderia fulva TaxID=613905 RepID=UPI0010FB7F73|nr:leucine-rich repeat-containing protein 47-like isoform X1 [Nylanderia fulva]
MMMDQSVRVKLLDRNQHHLTLIGSHINEAIKKQNGLDKTLFNNQNLTYLKISLTCLWSIPKEIEKLKDLTELVLRSNQIEELPDTINNLQKLQVLDCSHNKLKKCSLELPKLHRLNLSSNRLSRLTLMRANVMLSTLNLADNQFKDFPDICHEEFTHLSELYLNGNMIETVPPSFKKLSALKILNLADNNFTIFPDICYSEFENLSELYLNRNMIETVPPSFKKLSALKILNLADNKFKDFPDICHKEFTHLLELYLNGNMITTVPQLSLSFEFSALKILNLADNNFTIFPNIRNYNFVSLSELYLNGNKILYIPCNTSVISELAVLNLENNLLIDLPKELAHCPLKKLNLQQNNMSDEKLQLLCSRMDQTEEIKAYVGLQRYVPEDNSVQEQWREKKDLRPLLKFERSVTVIKVEIDCFKEIRPFIAACIIKKINFTVQSYKNFIQLHRKLQDEMCVFKTKAAIAIHDMDSIANGDLIYTTKKPEELNITPLSRNMKYTGKLLFEQLEAEAETECIIKKNESYSKRYEYLYLLKSKSLYPCLIDDSKDIISFPPIVSSNITKVSPSTETVFVEVTSTVSNEICRDVLNEFLKKLIDLDFIDSSLPEGDTKNMLIGGVKVEDAKSGNEILIYPTYNDLKRFPTYIRKNFIFEI